MGTQRARQTLEIAAEAARRMLDQLKASDAPGGPLRA